jgi:exonuclease III
MVVDFNIPLLPIDKSFRQKLSREILALTEVTRRMNLTDIYRTCHPNAKEYSLFSTTHENFSKIRHKASLNRYKKTEITPASYQTTMD